MCISCKRECPHYRVLISWNKSFTTVWQTQLLVTSLCSCPLCSHSCLFQMKPTPLKPSTTQCKCKLVLTEFGFPVIHSMQGIILISHRNTPKKNEIAVTTVIEPNTQGQKTLHTDASQPWGQGPNKQTSLTGRVQRKRK
jgi:hypothetical protein